MVVRLLKLIRAVTLLSPSVGRQMNNFRLAVYRCNSVDLIRQPVTDFSALVTVFIYHKSTNTVTYFIRYTTILYITRVASSLET